MVRANPIREAPTLGPLEYRYYPSPFAKERIEPVAAPPVKKSSSMG